MILTVTVPPAPTCELPTLEYATPLLIALVFGHPCLGVDIKPRYLTIRLFDSDSDRSFAGRGITVQDTRGQVSGEQSRGLGEARPGGPRAVMAISAATALTACRALPGDRTRRARFPGHGARVQVEDPDTAGVRRGVLQAPQSGPGLVPGHAASASSGWHRRRSGLHRDRGVHELADRGVSTDFRP